MNNTSNINPLFEWLSQNAALIAQGYLDPSVYFFFVFSIILFLFFWLTKKPPFDKPLIKRATLLFISILWLLLFFWKFIYIVYMLLLLVLLGLYQIKDELKQLILINTYKKKEFKVSLWKETEETDVLIIWSKSNIYSSFWFLQILWDLKELWDKIRYFFEKKLNILFVYLVYLNIIIFLFLVILILLSYDLFSTQYILKTQ